MAETLATYAIPEHHVIAFTNNVRAALARKGGELRSMVTSASYTGERAQVVDFLGPVVFIKRETRYQDTRVTELDHTSRWIVGDEYDVAMFIDKLDTLKMIYDPTSPYVERIREAGGRKEDEIIMGAFFAAAKTGKTGTASVAFPAQDVIPNGGAQTGGVVTNAGRMSIAKLRAARKLLKKRLVDIRAERPMILVSAEQTDDLLGEDKIGSTFYNQVRPLVDGEVSSFMGFTFVPMEQIIPSYTTNAPVGTGGASVPVVVRQCPVWVQSGMHYGAWEGMSMVINNRPDKNNIKQIHASFNGGATRLEEGKVLTLECLEY
jgi:hypothetical protein